MSTLLLNILSSSYPGSDTYRSTNQPEIVAQSTYRSVNNPEVIAGPNAGSPLPR